MTLYDNANYGALSGAV